MLFVAQDLPVVRSPPLQTNANRFRCFISLRVGFLYTHLGALHAYVFPDGDVRKTTSPILPLMVAIPSINVTFAII